ncbi:Chemotaxis protein CheV [hydrothermal vent metagenome]|uniref:Chemotaxis protein CheV n=1 Tax=hydrothermal vent metagenome TaxID=652676 RepID=A0A3B0WCP2_9ZZZZ
MSEYLLIKLSQVISFSADKLIKLVHSLKTGVENKREKKMSNILDGINQRTQLVGKNRLELLMFRLEDGELYGINVFKVREVIRCPSLTTVHSAHSVVRGVATIRNCTLSVIDLGLAIQGPAIDQENESYVIITEFNRSIQGFMVSSVEHIVNLKWEDIRLPPAGTDTDSYINAVTSVDGKLIQLVDVEHVLTEVVGAPEMVSSDITESVCIEKNQVRHVLVVDDSKVARNQISKALEQIGVECTTFNDGALALAQLKSWAREDIPVSNRIAMVISDIEMPEMDGYTLTSEIRRDPSLKDLYVLLHSSLSGIFNETMVKKVGANRFIPKFSADELVKEILPIIQKSTLSGSEAA